MSFPVNDQSRPDPRLLRLRQSIFFVSLPFGILMFALPLVGRSLGASALEIGGLFSTFALMLVVLRPFVGRGLDRFGRRPFLVAGLLGYALANAGYALAGNLWGLYLARLSQGLGSGLMWLAAYAIVADLAPAGHRGGRYGQIEEMASRGGIFGAAIGFTVLGFLGRGNLADGAGWSTLFWLYTATSLAGALIAWRGVPETLPRHMKTPRQVEDSGVPNSFGQVAGPLLMPGAAPRRMKTFVVTTSVVRREPRRLKSLLRTRPFSGQFSMPGVAPRRMKAAEAAPMPPERRAWEPDPLFSGQGVWPSETKGPSERPWRLPGQLRALMGIALLTTSASALLAPILMIYLRDHVTANLFGLATAYLPAAIASALLPSRLGRLSDRYGRRPPIAIALLVAAVVSTLIPQVRSLGPLALLWVLEAAAFAAATPAQEALVVDIAGPAQRGIAFGYYTAAASLGAVIGPLLGGWIYDTFSAVWAFRANAMMLGLGAVLIWVVVREQRRGNGGKRISGSTDGNG